MPHERYPDSPHGIDTVAVGNEFEEFMYEKVWQILRIRLDRHEGAMLQFLGENKQGWEFKLDQTSERTGRLAIEVQEKTKISRGWVNSGILRIDNTIFYCQGHFRQVHIFKKDKLREFYNEHFPEIIEFNSTIKRFFLPLDIAWGLAWRVWWLSRNGW